MKMSISADRLDLPFPNDYGIALDKESGNYYGSYQLPDYVNRKFVESVFSGLPDSRQENENLFE